MFLALLLNYIQYELKYGFHMQLVRSKYVQLFCLAAKKQNIDIFDK